MAVVDEEKKGQTAFAPAVAHFTACRARRARQAPRAPRCRAPSHAALELAPRPRPGRAARGAGDVARARAGADPLRPHARLAVHVLPRRRGGDGRDLAATPRAGLRAQLCGDAHLSNFGGFAVARAALVFDLNDFDETLPGPVRVGRQAARRQLRDRRPRPRLHRRGARAMPCCAVGARPTARRCASSPRCGNLDVWYARLDVDDARARARATAGDAEQAQARRAQRRQGAHEGQPAGVSRS